MKRLFYLLLLIVTTFSTLKISAQGNSAGFLNCIASIDGIDSRHITRQQLVNSKSLLVDSVDIKITSFKLSIYSKDTNPVILANNVNGTITPEMKKGISLCNIGSKIFIEYIRCADSKKVVHTLAPIAIQIK